MATIGTYADIGLGAFVVFGTDTYCFESVDGPNSEISDDIEITNSCSAEKEWLAGIIDGSNLTMTFNFDPDHPAKADRTKKAFTLFFPQKTGQPLRARYITTAYIKTAPTVIPIGDKMTQTITFKISGAETWRDGYGNTV